MRVQVTNQPLEPWLGSLGESLSAIIQPERNSLSRPTRELQTAKAETHFVRAGDNPRGGTLGQLRGSRGKSPNASDDACRACESRFDVTARNQPGLKIPHIRGIHLLNSRGRFVEFEHLQPHARSEPKRTFAEKAARSLRNEHTQSFDGALTS